MFCDLVGSTALSTKLDPEDLREVMSAYHECAADVVTRFGGYVAKYMGDGVLVYFGFPEAHETDAENAMRSALALIHEIDELFGKAGGHQVRVGIATGLVVVGELVGAGEVQERNVVGEPPNLAARLQSMAQPNTAIVDVTTRRLAGDLFEYEPVGSAGLKGFQEPVRAWRVLRERTLAGRFEVLRSTSRTPLIGRQEEVELLTRRWQQVQTGEGSVVLLSGEPGIGKSRLATALEESLAPETYVCLRYFCQPQHQGSALQPIIAQLQHAAGFNATDLPAEKLAKVEKMLTPWGVDAAEIELFAGILGLALVAPASASNDPQAKRRKALAALIAQIEKLAQRSPVLMLFEDAHWADPTSIELLTLIIERLQRLPVLLVVTFRPDFQAPWVGQPNVTALTLNRLSQRERAILVNHITGGKALPLGLLDQIVERTDGVPLFVEELTKAMLESEQLQEDCDRYVIEQPMQPLAIPTTLQASLMARVDRLGPAREVLQIGAAIGREFSYEVLAAVAGLPDGILQDALIRLTESVLLFLRGAPPNATYTFKHALMQDTAYSTMLRARRQQLHLAIACVLEEQFPDVVNSIPEVIAQQFERAGDHKRAIRYWRQAADRDLRRFALKESMAHYSNALRLIAAMPDTPERADLELSVCLGLGMAQQIGIGPTSKESAETYRRALTLAEALPDHGRERFLANWGLWFHSTMASSSAEAFRLGESLVATARELNDPDLLVEAYHARVPGMVWKGDIAAMKDAALEVVRRYDRERHRDNAYYFGGHDSRVCALSFHAMSLWGLGLADQARQAVRTCIEDARSLGHAFSLAHSLNMGSHTLLLLDDRASCQEIADELFPLAERNKFPWPLAQARFLRAWLAAQSGDSDGIELMVKALDEPSSANFRPMLLALIATELLRAERFSEAIATLDPARYHAHNTESRFYGPEVIRLRGAVLLAQSRDNAAEAESAFKEAIALAFAQSCRAIELRASVSLAMLFGESGRRADARDLLMPVYSSFTEGLDGVDLRAAKQLLEQLN
jgi:class 3 adenylate cyclase/predicted ATPase